MSLEAAIAKLTAAVEEQNALLRAGGGVATNPVPDKAADEPTGGGPGYWRTPDGSRFGAHQNLKEYKAAEKTHGEIEEITKTDYQALVKAKKEAEEDAAAKKDAAAAAKAKKDAASEEAAEVHPSEEALIAAFQKYLTKDLTKDERAVRAAKVKPYLTDRGVKRATDLKPEQRADAIAFVEGLVAELGEDDGEDDLL